MKKISEKKQLSAYLLLYQKIRTEIIDGIYKFGEKLPSKRSVADNNGVSVLTAAHAYDLLCDEGYVESRERSGYFVCFRKGMNYNAPSVKFPSIVNENYSEEFEQYRFPFSVLTKCMRKTINDFGENILLRSSNEGCVEVRTAIKDYLARSRNIYADIDQIIIGSGSEYLYNLIIGIFGKEKSFAIEKPSYEQIENVYKAEGVRYEMLALGKDGIESTALNTCKADILHISPYRSYPSGVTASPSKRYEYLEWSSVNDRYIIEDDFESEFSVLGKTEDTLFSLSQRENVIYVNTFSKTISPSFRMGYMIIPKKMVSLFHEKIGFYSCTVPTYMQLVLTELINEGDFERHINRIRRRLRQKSTD